MMYHNYHEEDSAKLDEAVELKQMELIKEGQEFYPYTGPAISEALGQATDRQLEIIGKLVADPTKATDLQIYLQAMSSSYWYAQAETTAIAMINASNTEYED